MRVVMLGTGTGVGKTYVTAQLAAALRPRQRVLALKPIETGVGAGEGGDAGAIAAGAGHQPLLSTWRFGHPVSPHLAAADQQSCIDVGAVGAWVAEQERRVQPDITLIETAGGAFTPLGRGTTNVDLALALEPGLWLLVAPDALGVLHDVGATLRALPRRPDALVLSSARPRDASSGRNAGSLRELGIAEVLAALGPGSSDLRAVVAWLESQ